MCTPAGSAASYAPRALGVATDDPFDRLPDALLLAVFNSLRDVKSLGRCCAVSRRFRLLALQADTILVRVDCVVSSSPSSSRQPDPVHDPGAAAASVVPKYSGTLGAVTRLLFDTFVSRPLHALHKVLLPRRLLLAAEISHHSPAEVLRGFREVRNLQIVLPSGELGVEPGAVLRWTAAFGRSLQGCTILGATSFGSCNADPDEIDATGTADPTNVDNAEAEVDDTSFCTNGGLKLRVVWTITSLIAASARHFLLRDIVTDHPTLHCLEITDADGQGLLRMEKEQLEEFRFSPLEVACSSNRTQVPALNMKLWYAPHLVLKSGHVMEGATLVVIMPVDQPAKLDIGDGFAVDAFGGHFREATRALLKRKAYLLEMNPF